MSDKISYGWNEQFVQKAVDNILPSYKKMSAFDKQVAGKHYKGMKIQPMEYALANQLGYCEATAIKYLSRWKLKGGLDDLDKAIHFIELLKEHAQKNPELYTNEGTYGNKDNKNVG